MPRLFKDGEKVLHLSKRKVGTVVGYVDGEEHRYLVNHSGYTWSVPEKGLDSKNSKIRIKEIKELQASKNVESVVLRSNLQPLTKTHFHR